MSKVRLKPRPADREAPAPAAPPPPPPTTIAARTVAPTVDPSAPKPTPKRSRPPEPPRREIPIGPAAEEYARAKTLIDHLPMTVLGEDGTVVPEPAADEGFMMLDDEEPALHHPNRHR